MIAEGFDDDNEYSYYSYRYEYNKKNHESVVYMEEYDEETDKWETRYKTVTKFDSKGN